MRQTWVRSLDREDPLEKEMATHSSILAWRIPWMEEPGGLQSTGSDMTERLHFRIRGRLMMVGIIGFLWLLHLNSSKILLQPLSLDRKLWSRFETVCLVGFKTESLSRGSQRVSLEITSFIERVISPPRISSWILWIFQGLFILLIEVLSEAKS